MIRFWTEKRNLSWLQTTSLAVLAAVLFTCVAPPFAEASVWDERKQAIEKIQEKKRLEQGMLQLQQIGATAPAPGRPAVVPVEDSTRRLSQDGVSDLALKSAGVGLEVPENLGSVVEIWGGRDDLKDKLQGMPTVIHIQDAHGYAEAQKNSAGILKSIDPADPKKSLLVCVEGAWDRVDPDWLSAFPDENLTRSLVQDLFRSGELNGEEYLALTDSSKKMDIYGIEDRDVYLANLKARTTLNHYREDLERRLDEDNRRLQRLAGSIFDARLQALNQAARKFGQQKANVGEYLNYLRKASPETWDPAAYPNLKLMAEMSVLEDLLPLPKVEAERKDLLEALNKKLDPSVLLQLAQVSLNYRNGKINPYKYYDGLLRLGKINRVETPSLEIYVAYLQKMQQVDAGRVSEELARLERSVFERLTRGQPSLQGLERAERALRLQEKFWNERLSPQDWKEYQSVAEADANDLRAIESYAAGQEKRLGLSAVETAAAPAASGSAGKPGPALIEALDSQAGDPAERLTFGQMKSLQESYYKLAFHRNEILVDNALKRARETGQDKIVLIAGGFHTPGLTALLRERGVPYAVVRPKLTSTQTAQPETARSQSPQPLSDEAYRALVEQYAQNLERLKRQKGYARGTAQARGIDNLIDTLRNRLSFAGPLRKDGHTYLLGAYQGNLSRVNFVLEFADPQAQGRAAVAEFRDALQAAVGTLRDLIPTFFTERSFSPLLVVQAARARAGLQDRISRVISDDEEVRRFLLDPQGFEIPAGRLTSQRVQELWGDLSDLYGVFPRVQGNRIYFERNAEARTPVGAAAAIPGVVPPQGEVVHAAEAAPVAEETEPAPLPPFPAGFAQRLLDALPGGVLVEELIAYLTPSGEVRVADHLAALARALLPGAAMPEGRFAEKAAGRLLSYLRLPRVQTVLELNALLESVGMTPIAIGPRTTFGGQAGTDWLRTQVRRFFPAEQQGKLQGADFEEIAALTEGYLRGVLEREGRSEIARVSLESILAPKPVETGEGAAADQVYFDRVKAAFQAQVGAAWLEETWERQVEAAREMLKGNLALLRTSGGKTNAIIAAAFVKLMQLRESPETETAGVLVWNPKSTLAERDAQSAAAILSRFGIAVGFIGKDGEGRDVAFVYRNGQAVAAKSHEEVYRTCSIIYGNTETFVHDYQSEMGALLPGGQNQMDRRWYVLMDEAHLILGEQATTPFVKQAGAAGAEEEAVLIGQANHAAQVLIQEETKKDKGSVGSQIWSYFFGVHLYKGAEAARQARLTRAGRGRLLDAAVRQILEHNNIEASDRLVAALAGLNVHRKEDGAMVEGVFKRLRISTEGVDFKALAQDLWGNLVLISGEDFARAVETALAAHLYYHGDPSHPEQQDYLVEDDQIVIINQATGQREPGRRFSNSLHAALEAKHGLTIHPDAGLSAWNTLPYYLRLPHILGFGGASGTIDEALVERVYRKSVVAIGGGAAAVPVQRRIYPDRDKAQAAAVAMAEEMHAEGRPVLLEVMSPEQATIYREALLAGGKIAEGRIMIVDARNQQDIRDLVAAMGATSGMVGIVTYIGALGTDYRVLEDAIKDVGGIRAIATFLDESTLNERQFAGRVRRAGDPGDVVLIGSLQDAIFTHYRQISGDADVARLRGLIGEGGEISGRNLRAVEDIIASIRKALALQALRSVEATTSRGRELQARTGRLLVLRQGILKDVLYDKLPDEFRAALQEKLTPEELAAFKARLRIPALIQIDRAIGEFLSEVAAMEATLGNLTATRSVLQQVLPSDSEYLLNLDRAYARVQERIRTVMDGSILADARAEIDEATGMELGAGSFEVGSEFSLRFQRAGKRIFSQARLRGVLSVLPILIIALAVGSLFYFSNSVQTFLSSLVLPKLTALFGMTAFSGPFLFIAGAIAIGLLLATLTLQGLFLNRIHAARQTGKPLSLYQAGANRSFRGLLGAFADVGFSLSNLMVSLSMIGTAGILLLSISSVATVSPIALVAAPLVALFGFLIAASTSFLGRKNLAGTPAFQTKTQRFTSDFSRGFVLSLTGAFAVVTIVFTHAVALPVAVAVGVGLLVAALVGLYLLPRRLVGNRTADRRVVAAGLLLGLLTGVGLVVAFGTGTIALSALMMAGRIVMLVTGAFLVGVLVYAVKQIGPLRARIAAMGGNGNLGLLSRIGLYFRAVIDLAALNQSKIVPIAVGAVTLGLLARNGFGFLSLLGPWGWGFVAVAIGVFIVFLRVSPKNSSMVMSVGGVASISISGADNQTMIATQNYVQSMLSSLFGSSTTNDPNALAATDAWWNAFLADPTGSHSPNSAALPQLPQASPTQTQVQQGQPSPYDEQTIYNNLLASFKQYNLSYSDNSNEESNFLRAVAHDIKTNTDIWNGYFDAQGHIAKDPQGNLQLDHVKQFLATVHNMRSSLLPNLGGYPQGVSSGFLSSIARELNDPDKRDGWKEFFNADGTAASDAKIRALFQVVIPNLQQGLAAHLSGFSESQRWGFLTAVGRDIASTQNYNSWAPFFNKEGVADNAQRRANVEELFRRMDELGALDNLLKQVGYQDDQIDGVKMAIAKDQIINPKTSLSLDQLKVHYQNAVIIRTNPQVSAALDSYYLALYGAPFFSAKHEASPDFGDDLMSRTTMAEHLLNPQGNGAPKAFTAQQLQNLFIELTSIHESAKQWQPLEDEATQSFYLLLHGQSQGQTIYPQFRDKYLLDDSQSIQARERRIAAFFQTVVTVVNVRKDAGTEVLALLDKWEAALKDPGKYSNVHPPYWISVADIDNMRHFIKGDPTITGLMFNPVTDPVSYVTTVMPQLGMADSPDGKTKDTDYLRQQFGYELMIQAMYNSYHLQKDADGNVVKNAQGVPISKSLTSAEIASYLNEIRFKAITVDQTIQILKYDGLFRDAVDQFPQAMVRELDGLGVQGQDPRQFHDVLKLSDAQYIGVATRIQFLMETGQIDRNPDSVKAYIDNWLKDAAYIQALHYMNFKGSYYLPFNILYSAVFLSRENQAALTDRQRLILQQRFSTIFLYDPSYRNEGTADNTRRLLRLTYLLNFGEELPPGSPLEAFFLQQWQQLGDEMTAQLQGKGLSDKDIQARVTVAQAEFMSRMKQSRELYLSLVAEQAYQANPDSKDLMNTQVGSGGFTLNDLSSGLMQQLADSVRYSLVVGESQTGDTLQQTQNADAFDAKSFLALRNYLILNLDPFKGLNLTEKQKQDIALKLTDLNVTDITDGGIQRIFTSEGLSIGGADLINLRQALLDNNSLKPYYDQQASDWKDQANNHPDQVKEKLQALAASHGITLTKDDLKFEINKMRETGYTPEQVFFRYAVITVYAQHIYVLINGVTDGLDSQQQGQINGIIDAIYRAGFLDPQDPTVVAAGLSGRYNQGIERALTLFAWQVMLQKEVGDLAKQNGFTLADYQVNQMVVHAMQDGLVPLPQGHIIFDSSGDRDQSIKNLREEFDRNHDQILASFSQLFETAAVYRDHAEAAGARVDQSQILYTADQLLRFGITPIALPPEADRATVRAFVEKNLAPIFAEIEGAQAPSIIDKASLDYILKLRLDADPSLKQRIIDEITDRMIQHKINPYDFNRLLAHTAQTQDFIHSIAPPSSIWEPAQGIAGPVTNFEILLTLDQEADLDKRLQLWSIFLPNMTSQDLNRLLRKVDNAKNAAEYEVAKKLAPPLPEDQPGWSQFLTGKTQVHWLDALWDRLGIPRNPNPSRDVTGFANIGLVSLFIAIFSTIYRLFTFKQHHLFGLSKKTFGEGKERASRKERKYWNPHGFAPFRVLSYQFLIDFWTIFFLVWNFAVFNPYTHAISWIAVVLIILPSVILIATVQKLFVEPTIGQQKSLASLLPWVVGMGAVTIGPKVILSFFGSVLSYPVMAVVLFSVTMVWMFLIVTTTRWFSKLAGTSYALMEDRRTWQEVQAFAKRNPNQPVRGMEHDPIRGLKVADDEVVDIQQPFLPDIPRDEDPVKYFRQEIFDKVAVTLRGNNDPRLVVHVDLNWNNFSWMERYFDTLEQIMALFPAGAGTQEERENWAHEIITDPGRIATVAAQGGFNLDPDPILAILMQQELIDKLLPDTLSRETRKQIVIDLFNFLPRSDQEIRQFLASEGIKRIYMPAILDYLKEPHDLAKMGKGYSLTIGSETMTPLRFLRMLKEQVEPYWRELTWINGEALKRELGASDQQIERIKIALYAALDAEVNPWSGLDMARFRQEIERVLGRRIALTDAVLRSLVHHGSERLVLSILPGGRKPMHSARRSAYSTYGDDGTEGHWWGQSEYERGVKRSLQFVRSKISNAAVSDDLIRELLHADGRLEMEAVLTKARKAGFGLPLPQQQALLEAVEQAQEKVYNPALLKTQKFHGVKMGRGWVTYNDEDYQNRIREAVEALLPALVSVAPRISDQERRELATALLRVPVERADDLVQLQHNIHADDALKRKLREVKKKIINLEEVRTILNGASFLAHGEWEDGVQEQLDKIVDLLKLAVAVPGTNVLTQDEMEALAKKIYDADPASAKQLMDQNKINPVYQALILGVEKVEEFELPFTRLPFCYGVVSPEADTLFAPWGQAKGERWTGSPEPAEFGVARTRFWTVIDNGNAMVAGGAIYLANIVLQEQEKLMDKVDKLLEHAVRDAAAREALARKICISDPAIIPDLLAAAGVTDSKLVQDVVFEAGKAGAFLYQAATGYESGDTMWQLEGVKAHQSLWYTQIAAAKILGGIRAFGKYSGTSVAFAKLFQPRAGLPFGGYFTRIWAYSGIFNLWMENFGFEHAHNQAQLSALIGKIILGTFNSEDIIVSNTPEDIVGLWGWLKHWNRAPPKRRLGSAFLGILLGTLPAVLELLIGRQFSTPLLVIGVVAGLGLGLIFNIGRSSFFTFFFGSEHAHVKALNAFKTSLVQFQRTKRPPFQNQSVSLVTLPGQKPIIIDDRPLWFGYEVIRAWKWVGQFDIPGGWLRRIGRSVSQGLRGEAFDKLVDRGLISELLWSILLVQGFIYMGFLPGAIEIYLSNAAWWLSLVTLIILVHSKITGPILARIFNPPKWFASSPLGNVVGLAMGGLLGYLYVVGFAGGGPLGLAVGVALGALAGFMLSRVQAFSGVFYAPIALLQGVFIDLPFAVAELVTSTTLYLTYLFIKPLILFRSMRNFLRSLKKGEGGGWNINPTQDETMPLTSHMWIGWLPYTVGVSLVLMIVGTWALPFWNPIILAMVSLVIGGLGIFSLTRLANPAAREEYAGYEKEEFNKYFNKDSGLIRTLDPAGYQELVNRAQTALLRDGGTFDEGQLLEYIRKYKDVAQFYRSLIGQGEVLINGKTERMSRIQFLLGGFLRNGAQDLETRSMFVRAYQAEGYRKLVEEATNAGHLTGPDRAKPWTYLTHDTRYGYGARAEQLYQAAREAFQVRPMGAYYKGTAASVSTILFKATRRFLWVPKIMIGVVLGLGLLSIAFYHLNIHFFLLPLGDYIQLSWLVISLTILLPLIAMPFASFFSGFFWSKYDTVFDDKGKPIRQKGIFKYVRLNSMVTWSLGFFVLVMAFLVQIPATEPIFGPFLEFLMNAPLALASTIMTGDGTVGVVSTVLGVRPPFVALQTLIIVGEITFLIFGLLLGVPHWIVRYRRARKQAKNNPPSTSSTPSAPRPPTHQGPSGAALPVAPPLVSPLPVQPLPAPAMVTPQAQPQTPKGRLALAFQALLAFLPNLTPDKREDEKDADVYLLMGSPDVNTYVEFARWWLGNPAGRKPIVLAGGRGRGTGPLFKAAIAHMRQKGTISAEQAAQLEEMAADKDEIVALRSLLVHEGIPDEFIHDERTAADFNLPLGQRASLHSVRTLENFQFSEPVIAGFAGQVQNRRPRVALVTWPPLLYRAQLVAQGVWPQEWDIFRFKAYNVTVDEHTPDAELEAMVRYIVYGGGTEAASVLNATPIADAPSEVKGIADALRGRPESSAFQPQIWKLLEKVRQAFQAFVEPGSAPSSGGASSITRILPGFSVLVIALVGLVGILATTGVGGFVFHDLAFLAALPNLFSYISLTHLGQASLIHSLSLASGVPILVQSGSAAWPALALHLPVISAFAPGLAAVTPSGVMVHPALAGSYLSAGGGLLALSGVAMRLQLTEPTLSYRYFPSSAKFQLRSAVPAALRGVWLWIRNFGRGGDALTRALREAEERGQMPLTDPLCAPALLLHGKGLVYVGYNDRMGGEAEVRNGIINLLKESGKEGLADRLRFVKIDGNGTLLNPANLAAAYPELRNAVVVTMFPNLWQMTAGVPFKAFKWSGRGLTDIEARLAAWLDERMTEEDARKLFGTILNDLLPKVDLRADLGRAIQEIRTLQIQQ